MIIDYATKKNLREEISSIDDVIFIKEIELLSHEKNEQKLLAVIDSVDEGIISIDKILKLIYLIIIVKSCLITKKKRL